MKVRYTYGRLGTASRWIAPACAAIALSTSLFAAASREGPRNTDWAVLGNGDNAGHHADLDQINAENVAGLGLAWAVDLPSPDGLVGEPLIKDGIAYDSGALGHMYAVDMRAGKMLWDYLPDHDFGKIGLGGLWGARINRGLAIAGNLAVASTGDCHVVAVDRKSGAKVWDVQICDSAWQSNTSAPRVGGGKIFVGHGCGDTGAVRDYVQALDEKTGKELWRFYTVPGDPAIPDADPVMKMAAKSWGTDWYGKSKGCGSAWDAMTYDPKLNLLYVGVGGPSPWSPAKRAHDAGDELFTNAIVALNADTGKYVWHYTATPHDGWNLEATTPTIVADLPINGTVRHVLMATPKNGFFYVLDAKTGEFISAKNPVPVNWAKGIDPKTGRPIYDPDTRYWEKPEGALLNPGPVGARGPAPMAYDPKSRVAFVPYDNIPEWMVAKEGQFPEATIPGLDPSDPHHSDPRTKLFSRLIAWNPAEQKQIWSVMSDSILNGGVLHTSGGLIFQGTTDGWLNAYEDKTGKKVWSYHVLGGIRAAPSTVMVDGAQYIVVPSGNNGSSDAIRYTTPRSTSPMTRAAPSRLLAFKLGGKAMLTPFEPQRLSKPGYPEPDQHLAEIGAKMYKSSLCMICHGRDAISPGGGRPDLRMTAPEMLDQLDAIVREGALKDGGMPQLAFVTSDDLKAIKAYVQHRAWQDYREQEAQKH